MSSINVLILDPDPARRELIVDHLSRALGIRVVRAGGDFLTVLQAYAARLPVDVLLINIDHAAISGIRAWAAIHVLLPNARLVALTNGDDDRILESVIGAGVTALHLTGAEPAVLCRALRNAARSIVDFDPQLIDRAMRMIVRPLAEVQARFGGLTVDLQAQEVTRWGKRVHLTPLEFRLLAYLARHAGRPASLTELLEAVWGSSPSRGGTLAQVHNCIKRIRQKIEPDVKHPRYLLCARSWGYFLQDPAEPGNSVPPIGHELTSQTSPESIASKN